MDADDRQVGRILRRREVLALLGVAGGAVVLSRTGLFGGTDAALAQTATTTTSTNATITELARAPACVVKPELTEGPYFVDDQFDRSDIRSEPSDGSLRDGVPLALTFNVSQVGSAGCLALGGARVDVWHCDALGVYSGVNDNTSPSSTVGEKFLRGYQATDVDGAARFLTIYPGWYAGRAVHIHFKIRTTDTTGNAYEFTSQLFMDEAITDQVHSLQPYARKGQRTTHNSADSIFRDGGDQLLITPIASADGYAAGFAIGLDLSDATLGAADGMQGGPRGAGFPGGPGGRGPGGR